MFVQVIIIRQIYVLQCNNIITPLINKNKNCISVIDLIISTTYLHMFVLNFNNPSRVVVSESICHLLIRTNTCIQCFHFNKIILVSREV